MGIDRSSGRPDKEPDRPREELRPDAPADHRESVQAQPETRSRQEYYDILAFGRGYEIVSFAALMAERPASDRHEWQIPLSQGEVDRCGLGVIDERTKRFSAAERRIAEHLADPGPAVVSVSEGFGIYGRTADARVNGISVEFKSLDPGAGDRTVKAALNSAKGQARHAVIDARDSGLTGIKPTAASPTPAAGTRAPVTVRRGHRTRRLPCGTRRCPGTNGKVRQRGKLKRVYCHVH